MLEQFFDDLENYGAPYVFNPWRETASDDRLPFPALARRQRLRTHLSTPNPKFLLIGEAPGYRGCRITGVPFTSESLLYAGSIPHLDIEQQRLSNLDLPWSENSSTVIWQALHTFNIAESVVMWNAYPFHPHQHGNPLTNRKPVASELHDGLVFLETLLHHFYGIYPVAVGKVAANALNQLNTETYTVLRHPSFGGAGQFRKGLTNLVNSL